MNNTDNDVIDTEEEIELQEKIEKMDDADARRDSQRVMAWFALFGMLSYPILIIIMTFFRLESGAKLLCDISGTYFVSVAAIVAAFYTKEGFINSKK